MKATLQAEEKTVTLEFDEVADIEAWFGEVKEQTGFYVQLDRELRQYQRLAFTSTAPGFEFGFEAEVLQVFPGANGFGTAFRLCWRPGQSEELARKLAGEPEPESADPSVQSPLFKIRAMNPNERFMLATKATRTERQILLRDTSPQVLLGLLSHPQIETKEVLELVKSNFATGAMMDRVAGNRQWMSNPEVHLAIIKSPKTSPPLAIKLLDTARTQDLRMLAKSSSLRELVRRAALRVYLKRTGQHGV